METPSRRDSRSAVKLSIANQQSNVTPFEPDWEGFVTLEISSTTPLPAKIYVS